MPAIRFKRLTERRDELGLTNAQLAARAEMHQRSLENILYGVDNPSGRVIHKLARALDLPVSEIRGADKPERQPQGDPSEPPNQPPNSPTGPTRRQQREGRRSGTAPRRLDTTAGAA